MNDPPPKSDSSHLIPTGPQTDSAHESDRARLIDDLAFLVVQFHRRRQQTTRRTDSTKPNAAGKRPSQDNS